MILRRAQIIVILSSVWVLAVILPNIQVAPGNWAAVQQILAKTPPSLENLPGIIVALAFLFLLGPAVFVLRGRKVKRKEEEPYEIYREPVPTPWWIYAVIVLFFVFVGGLAWWAQQSPSVIEERGRPPVSSSPSAPGAPVGPTVVPPKAPPIYKFSASQWVAYLLAVGMLGGLSWTVWRLLRVHPVEREIKVPDVGPVAAQAVLELEKGAELTDVVLRCYREMCRTLRRRAALREDMTAREFAWQLEKAGVHEKEVAKLTALFEKVRYGRHPTGPDDRAEAISLLKAIESQYGKAADEI